MSVVFAEKLSKWYGEVIGLNQLSVSIGEGITGLVGPNGAGKTTLIRIITGLIRQEKGQISVLGEKPWNNPLVNKKVGYCPEHENMYSWMTGLDFLTIMSKMQGYGHEISEKNAYEALERLGMSNQDMKRKIAGYSKGMRQKVKVAQSFIHNPDLLVLDEPLAGTDPMVRKTIIENIRIVANEGKNIIVSSHVLHEVERLTNQVVLINAGRVLAIGNIHQIRRLIDQHPHTVQLTTPDARLLGKELIKLDMIVSIDILDNQHLLIKTPSPENFYQILPKVIVNNNIAVEELFSPDDNLQAVFKYLVKK
jgi:ABC-2 type transport system ATP-binding protein